MSKGEADAGARICSLGIAAFSFEALICHDTVQPFLIALEAEDEHGIVGQCDALSLALRVIIAAGRLSFLVSFGAQAHRPLRAKAYVHNRRVLGDIECLV